MRSEQPAWGNAGRSRGQRMVEKRDTTTPAEHDRKSARAGRIAIGGALAGTAGSLGEAHAMTKPGLYASRAGMVGGTAALIGGAAVSQHHHEAAKKKRWALIERALRESNSKQTVGKTRFFDPEHRRQRRMGAAQAALAGGAVAGLGLGGRNIVRTSRLARKMGGVAAVGNEDVAALRAALKHGGTATRRDLAITAGGAASGGGAIAVNRHAESRKGRGWN